MGTRRRRHRLREMALGGGGLASRTPTRQPPATFPLSVLPTRNVAGVCAEVLRLGDRRHCRGVRVRPNPHLANASWAARPSTAGRDGTNGVDDLPHAVDRVHASVLQLRPRLVWPRRSHRGVCRHADPLCMPDGGEHVVAWPIPLWAGGVGVANDHLWPPTGNAKMMSQRAVDARLCCCAILPAVKL